MPFHVSISILPTLLNLFSKWTDFYEAISNSLLTFSVFSQVALRQEASIVSPRVVHKKFMRTAKFPRQQQRWVALGFTPTLLRDMPGETRKIDPYEGETSRSRGENSRH